MFFCCNFYCCNICNGGWGRGGNAVCCQVYNGEEKKDDPKYTSPIKNERYG